MPDDSDRKRARSPALGLPVSGVSADPIDTAVRAIGRQQRDTQQTAHATLDRVGALRTELGRRIDQLDTKVDGLEVGSARVEGKVDVLLEEFRVVSRERSQIRVSAVQASIEVEKTGEIAEINEAVAKRADRRQLLVKVLAVVGPVLAAALTYLLAKC